MSLNWNATKLPPSLLTYQYTFEGKQHEQQDPKLHRFIWLTLAINRDLTGGPKAKAEFLRRFKALCIMKPSLCQIEAGVSNLDGNEEYWAGHVMLTDKVFRYTLTEDDVNRYWGLETNAFGREAYSKWLVRQMDNSIRD